MEENAVMAITVMHLNNVNSSSLLYLIGRRKKFYTSINSMSKNLRTILFQPAPKMYTNVYRTTILMTMLKL